MMWILNLSDGENDLIEILQRSGIKVKELYLIIDKLLVSEILSKK